MADISRSEMGLIIGLVLGTLSVALAAVLTYIMYDNHRTKRNAAFRFHAAGSNAQMPPAAQDPVPVPVPVPVPDPVLAPAPVTAPTPVLPTPPAAGHNNWTTINNGMIGLEMCETSPSQSGPAADTPSSQQNAADGPTPHPGGSSTGRNFLALMLSLALPRALSGRSRSSHASPEPGGVLTDAAASLEDHVKEAVAAGGSGAAAATAAAAAVATSDVTASEQRTSAAKSTVVSEPLHPILPGGEAELAVVMVQLCDTDDGSDGEAGADELPLSGCLADAMVSLTLGPPVCSSHPADTATFIDTNFANILNGVTGKAKKSSLKTGAMVRKLAAPLGLAFPPPCHVGSGVGADNKSSYSTISATSWSSETSGSCILDFEVVTDGPHKAAQMTGRMPAASAVVKIKARVEGLGGSVIVCRPLEHMEV